MRWLRGLFFENFGWKVLSLGIAVLLWVVVASEPEFTTLATVRLEYRNLPRDLEISSEPVSSITLELRGPSGELRGDAGTGIRPALVLDLGEVQSGQRTFTISSDNVRLPRGVRLVRAIPSEVRFEFDRRGSREIPVLVRVTGEGENGYVVSHKSAEPARIAIVGPESRVGRVTAAVTDPVDVSNVVGSMKFQVNAFVEDPYVRFEKSPRVTVSVTMVKRGKV